MACVAHFSTVSDGIVPTSNRRGLPTLTVFISGPMSKKRSASLKEFYKAEAYLKARGCKVINPVAFPCFVGRDSDMYQWSITEGILNGCDGVYMLKGWDDDPQCMRTRSYALQIGLAVYDGRKDFKNKEES